MKNVQTLLLRPGLNYHASKNTILTAGYAFVDNRRTSGTVSSLVPEHRIWEQFLFNHKWSRLFLTHRFRLEQRFIPVTHVVNEELEVVDRMTSHRLRYFIRNLLPLKKDAVFQSGFFAALQNEVFLNIAKQDAANGKTFDQNRLYGALGYRIRKIDLEAGYLYQYIQTAASSVHNHVIQVAVYKRL